MKQLKITLFFICLITSSCVFAQENEFIPELKNKLNCYFKFFSQEKVFVSTDKDIYKAGETIWFNASVYKCSYQNSDLQSTELTVKIYNDEGKVISDDKYKLENGKAYGDFELSDYIPDGIYFLIAYTNIHNQTEDVYSKAFQIKSYYQDELLVQIIPSQQLAKNGKEARFYIVVEDMEGNPVNKQTLIFNLLAGNKKIKKGKLKTDESGKADIQVILPEQSEGNPLTLELLDKRNNLIKKHIIPTTLDKVELSFYPEGGNIVPGVPVKIGFTAKNTLGQPLNVEGQIIDGQENIVAQIKSFYSGFGLFSFLAKNDTHYRLILTGEMGKGQSFSLPDAIARSFGLAIPKTDDQYIYIDVFSPFIEEQDYVLTVTNCNSLNWVGNIQIKESARMKIPVIDIPQGINMVSLFDSNQSLLAHRIIYINKNQSLNIQVESLESILKPGKTNELKISLTDENNNPIQGNISLSIGDKFNLNSTEESLPLFMSINSNLKNKITEIKDFNSRAFDYMLIANEMKDFNWNRILQFDSTLTKSGNNLTISGKVVNKKGEAIPNAKISLIDKRSIHFISEVANDQGNFSFSGLDPAKKDNYIASATGANGEKECEIVFDKSFEEKLSACIANKHVTFSNQETAKDIVNYFRENKMLLSEKTVFSAPTSNRNESIRRSLENGVAILDVIKMIKPYRMVGDKIVFYGSQNSFNIQDGALIVIDGQQIGSDASVLSSLSPNDVDRINVSTNIIDVQRYTGLNSVGLIEIFTKTGGSILAKKSTPKLRENLYNGEYRIPKNFTVPNKDSLEDFRTTLLWMPNIQTTPNGIAEISFPTSTVKSEFIIYVDGISVNGRFGSKTANFKVE